MTVTTTTTAHTVNVSNSIPFHDDSMCDQFAYKSSTGEEQFLKSVNDAYNLRTKAVMSQDVRKMISMSNSSCSTPPPSSPYHELCKITKGLSL